MHMIPDPNPEQGAVDQSEPQVGQATKGRLD